MGVGFLRDGIQSSQGTTQPVQPGNETVAKTRKRYATHHSFSTRSVILVHNDLGHIRSGHRSGWAVLLVRREEFVVRSRANLLIVAFPIILLLKDEFLPIDQPAFLYWPVVLLPVNFGSLLGRGFNLFLLLLPLGTILRRFRSKRLLSFLFPLLEFSLIGFLARGEYKSSKR